MIICSQNRLAFVHIVKTAGSSLTALLAPYTVPELRNADAGYEGYSWQKDWHFKGRQHGLYKESADELRALVPNFDNFTVLTVVRNPYDWLISIYRDFYAVKIWRKRGPRARFAQEYPDQKFSDFLEYLKNRRDVSIFGTLPQSQFLEGTQAPHRAIVNFESLDRDLPPVLAAHGISGTLPQFNSKPRPPEIAKWRADPGLIAYCNDQFAQDFKDFRYVKE